MKISSLILLFIVSVNLCSASDGSVNNSGAIINRGNYSEAIIQYDRVLETDPVSFEALVSRGEALMNLEDFTGALDSFDKALSLDHDSAEVWLHRGYALFKLSRYREALESFDRSLRLNNSEKKAWYYRGDTLGILGRYEEALGSYDTALMIDGNYSVVWNERGYYLNTLRRYDEALDSYSKATGIDQNFSDAWYNLGNMQVRSGRYREAVDSYSRAIDSNSNDTGSLIGKGNALLFLGQYDAALRSFDKAAAIEPNNSLVWYNRGNVLYLMKNYSEAKESNQRATRLFRKTKELDVNATLEVDQDFRKDQIGLIGETYPLLLELKAGDDIDLSGNIYIEFLKNGKQITLSNYDEILIDVFVDGRDYWSPLFYDPGYMLDRKVLLKGENGSFRLNVTFLSPGIYDLIVTTHERQIPLVVQIVDPITMRDLKDEIKGSEIEEKGNLISIVAAGIAIIAAVIGPGVLYSLTRRWNEQKNRIEYINLINTKLDELGYIRETWMKVRKYGPIRDHFVLISNELAGAISKTPGNFPEDILNDLRILYKLLNDLSTYTIEPGEDTVFEEKSQTLVDLAIRIKQKLRFIK